MTTKELMLKLIEFFNENNVTLPEACHAMAELIVIESNRQEYNEQYK